jgi:hypothetical protein
MYFLIIKGQYSVVVKYLCTLSIENLLKGFVYSDFFIVLYATEYSILNITFLDAVKSPPLYLNLAFWFHHENWLLYFFLFFPLLWDNARWRENTFLISKVINVWLWWWNILLYILLYLHPNVFLRSVNHLLQKISRNILLIVCWLSTHLKAMLLTIRNRNRTRSEQLFFGLDAKWRLARFKIKRMRSIGLGMRSSSLRMRSNLVEDAM